MSDIDLLLAEYDTGASVLSGGMAMDAAAQGTRLKTKPDDVADFYEPSGDPNDLEAQGWGVVVPEGPEGEHLLALIEPLRKKREQQQGLEPMVFKVKKDMSLDATWEWWKKDYSPLPSERQPRYLLVLGDADLVSWDFQTILGANLFVGRLAFPKDEDYQAYVDKVLRYERADPADGARALYFTVRDGTSATTAGHAGLTAPSVAAAHRQAEAGKFHAKEIKLLNDDGSVSREDFLAAAGQPTPTMLFSVSHGLGAPRKGWTGGLEEQRRFQGAMSFGAGQRITHEDVANKPFLPGGAWFFFACLGAGTPSSSAYKHWLAKLKELNLYPGSPDEVLRSLPPEGSGQPGFVSRLPQAALANPDGPLSILGHVDLAWTFSFQKYTVGQNNKTVVTNQSRFDTVFQALVEGKRMGPGYTEFSRIFNIANGELTTIFDQEAKNADKGIAPTEDLAKKVTRATLWMERQDIAAYALLGDPAARLNVDPKRAQQRVREPIPEVALKPPPAQAPAAPVEATTPAPPPAPAASRVKEIGIDTVEEAILAVLLESKTAKVVADELKVDKKYVQALADAYRSAGRKAIEDK